MRMDERIVFLLQTFSGCQRMCCHHDIGILETFFVLYNRNSKTHLDIIHSTALQLYDPVFFTRLYRYV